MEHLQGVIRMTRIQDWACEYYTCIFFSNIVQAEKQTSVWMQNTDVWRHALHINFAAEHV